MGEDIGGKNYRVIIAGGGTGGHLFPGIAVGKALLKRYPETDILFVTAGRDIETRILEGNGFKHKSITVEGIKGRGMMRSSRALLKLPCSLFQCLAIIKKMSPDIILGVGGYSSGPVCISGRLMGIPVAIHEQNSYPGLTNRLLSRIVSRIFISFEDSMQYFPGGRIVFTGNPVRDEFIKQEDYPQDEKRPFTIFVTGGSQGAVAVNSVFIDALKILKQKKLDVDVIHHAGQVDYDRVVREYRINGINGEIFPFIDNMADAYGRSDIFIGRAGAGTIFELAAMGRPSILIPLPNSANRHQESNAMSLVNAGGAIMFLQDEMSGETMADQLIKLMNDRASLKRMGENARMVAKVDAAELIVDEMCKLVSSN